MSTPTFFHEPLNEQDEFVTLSSVESSHAAGARRLRVGQPVSLLNGAGLVAEGCINQLERRAVSVQLSAFSSSAKPKPQLTIATAVPKGDRQKVMLDMLTQLGVARIVPLTCEFSVTRFNGKTHEKWRRYAVEACKQSRNPWLPEVSAPQSFSDFLNVHEGELLVADAGGASMTKSLYACSEAIVLIGPEGGFSPTEHSKLLQNKVKYIELGPYILRTEAAAVAAASQWVQYTKTLSSS